VFVYFAVDVAVNNYRSKIGNKRFVVNWQPFFGSYLLDEKSMNGFSVLLRLCGETSAVALPDCLTELEDGVAVFGLLRRGCGVGAAAGGAQRRPAALAPTQSSPKALLIKNMFHLHSGLEYFFRSESDRKCESRYFEAFGSCSLTLAWLDHP